MKILHIIDVLNPGGAERVCIDLANIFAARGHEVGILMLLNEAGLDSAIEEGISIHYLSRTSKFEFSKYVELSKICNTYEIVHVHMRHVYRYVAMANLISGIKAKIIFHDHFGDIEKNKSVPFLFSNLIRPDYYIGVSTALTNWAKQKVGLKPEVVFLLSNIIRKQRVVGNQNEKLDLVLVSNIRRTKNIEFAITLAAETNLRLDIIGQPVDDQYYQMLLRKIDSEGLSQQVQFIHDCYNVQTQLSKYRLAIHTATSETGPLVLMEFLAQGLNFIAYQTGEVAELLVGSLKNFFMDSFEVSEWKERMFSLIQSPVERALLESLFDQEFDEEKYYHSCLDIYQKILY